jgi:hypothetical protein
MMTNLEQAAMWARRACWKMDGHHVPPETELPEDPVTQALKGSYVPDAQMVEGKALLVPIK